MYVFISYNHSNKEFVDNLSKVIDELGLDYFLDEKSVNWGDDINIEIERAFSKATHLIVVISPGSLKSQWVSYEVGLARATKLTILPLLTDPSLDLPYFLARFNYKTSLDDVKNYLQQEKTKPSAQLLNLLKVIDERFEMWKSLKYSGRGDALISPNEFKPINKFRDMLTELDKERLAYLFRCAVQNGLNAEWGKWLWMNKDNELIVYPLVIVLDGIAGWRPRWRSAYILEITFGDDIALLIQGLSSEIIKDANTKAAFEVMATSGVSEYLDTIAESNHEKKEEATLVKDEIAKFLDGLANYKDEQTVKERWLELYGKKDD